MAQENNEDDFWTARRLDRLSLAFTQLFQALAVGAFVTEALLKALWWWRVVFVIALLVSAAAGVWLCPSRVDELPKGG